MKKRKFKYQCAINGVIRVGNMTGLCGKKIIGDNKFCGAHGNRKCPHKSKLTKQQTGET